MLNKKFLQKLHQDYAKTEGERRQIIGLSNVVLHDSKRAIFALHRDEIEKAKESLDEIKKVLAKLEKQFTFNRIRTEGAYKAAVEEFVEAEMFYRVMSGGKVDKIAGLNIDIEGYLGGICDTTGEMVRWAVNKAAKKDFSAMEKIKDAINDIMAELVEFDMTGYLRTKYDQARGNLRKVEQVSYEVSLRK